MRLLHDWILVELEPARQKAGSIIIPDPDREPLRTGLVLATGPGKSLASGHVSPLAVSAGERVCFHMANLQTKQGKAICYTLEQGRGLIREPDVLFVLDGDVQVAQ